MFFYSENDSEASGGGALPTSWSLSDTNDKERYFGYSIRITSDNQTMAIGSTIENKVHIYENQNGVWAEMQVLSGNSEQFGNYVCFSGDNQTLAVGAYRYNGSQGRVHIYSKQGSSWTKTATITNPYSDGSFGHNMSLNSDGTYMVVGAYYAFNTRGGAFVYKNVNGSWQKLHEYQSPTPSAPQYVYFGISVQFSSDASVLAIGETGAGAHPGKIYIFNKESADSWTLSDTISTSDGQNGDSLSYNMGMSSDGTVIAAGAANAAYIFENVNGVWEETKLVASDAQPSEGFGNNIALTSDGLGLLVGARAADVGQVQDLGAAYVFQNSGGVWTEKAKLTIDEQETGRNFTTNKSMDISDDMNTIVGATIDTGKVYIFQAS